MHGNAKSEAELTYRPGAGDRPDRDRQLRRDRPPGGPPRCCSVGACADCPTGACAGRPDRACTVRGRAACGPAFPGEGKRSSARPHPRHPRRARRHSREDLDRSGRLQVRVLDGRHSGRDRACARSARPRAQGIHAHIGSQLLELEPFRREVSALAQIGDGVGGFSTYDLGGGLGVAYTEAQHPPEIEAWVGAAHRRRPRRRHRPERAHPGRAGARLDGQRGRHALHGRVGQAQRLHLGRGGRRHVRQPASHALRRRLRSPPGRSVGLRGRRDRLGRPALRARGQALRVGRCDRARSLPR